MQLYCGRFSSWPSQSLHISYIMLPLSPPSIDPVRNMYLTNRLLFVTRLGSTAFSSTSPLPEMQQISPPMLRQSSQHGCHFLIVCRLSPLLPLSSDSRPCGSFATIRLRRIPLVFCFDLFSLSSKSAGDFRSDAGYALSLKVVSLILYCQAKLKICVLDRGQ